MVSAWRDMGSLNRSFQVWLKNSSITCVGEKHFMPTSSQQSSLHLHYAQSAFRFAGDTTHFLIDQFSDNISGRTRAATCHCHHCTQLTSPSAQPSVHSCHSPFPPTSSLLPFISGQPHISYQSFPSLFIFLLPVPSTFIPPSFQPLFPSNSSLLSQSPSFLLRLYQCLQFSISLNSPLLILHPIPPSLSLHHSSSAFPSPLSAIISSYLLTPHHLYSLQPPPFPSIFLQFPSAFTPSFPSFLHISPPFTPPQLSVTEKC